MFFKRVKLERKSFADRIQDARGQGFEVTESGASGNIVIRKGCAAIVREAADGSPVIAEHGLLVDGQLAKLINSGYQMFFETPDGKKHAALSEHLKAVHAFREDLVEALGLTSYYNTSLGSTSSGHVYDRVKDRDKGEPKRVWQQARNGTHPG